VLLAEEYINKAGKAKRRGINNKRQRALFAHLLTGLPEYAVSVQKENMFHRMGYRTAWAIFTFSLFTTKPHGNQINAVT
jgi:Mn-dependent DtxR family transcriptional regulator